MVEPLPQLVIGGEDAEAHQVRRSFIEPGEAERELACRAIGRGFGYGDCLRVSGCIQEPLDPKGGVWQSKVHL